MQNSIKNSLSYTYIVWRESNKVYHQIAKKFNISDASLCVLNALFEHPDGCTQKQICNEWILPKQTVNTLLMNFQKLEYIYFSLDEFDKRNKKIIVSEKGKTYIDNIITQLKKIEENTIKKIGVSKMNYSSDILSNYNKILEKELQTITYDNNIRK